MLQDGGHLGIIFGCFGSHLEINIRSRGQLEPERLEEGKKCFFVSGLAIRAGTPISLQSGEPRTLKHCKTHAK